jgi:hypothetical protein
MLPASPTFADSRPFPDSLEPRLREVLGPASPLLHDPDFLAQCANFQRTLSTSAASEPEKRQYFLNFVTMMANLKRQTPEASARF